MFVQRFRAQFSKRRHSTLPTFPTTQEDISGPPPITTALNTSTQSFPVNWARTAQAVNATSRVEYAAALTSEEPQSLPSRTYHDGQYLSAVVGAPAIISAGDESFLVHVERDLGFTTQGTIGQTAITVADPYSPLPKVGQWLLVAFGMRLFVVQVCAELSSSAATSFEVPPMPEMPVPSALPEEYPINAFQPQHNPELLHTVPVSADPWSRFASTSAAPQPLITELGLIMDGPRSHSPVQMGREENRDYLTILPSQAAQDRWRRLSSSSGRITSTTRTSHSSQSSTSGPGLLSELGSPLQQLRKTTPMPRSASDDVDVSSNSRKNTSSVSWRGSDGSEEVAVRAALALESPQVSTSAIAYTIVTREEDVAAASNIEETPAADISVTGPQLSTSEVSQSTRRGQHNVSFNLEDMS